jgi:hypothetical protein
MAGTVTVACRYPPGLHLELKGHPRITVRGPSVAWGDPPHAIGGFAMTHGVDADFMAAWLTANKELDMVKKNLIFTCPKPADAAAAATDLREAKSGLEPLDPDKPGPGLERVGA